jgi:hypothetical protein
MILYMAASPLMGRSSKSSRTLMCMKELKSYRLVILIILTILKDFYKNVTSLLHPGELGRVDVG